MTRTLASALVDAQRALAGGEMARPQWTEANVYSVRLVGRARKRLVGELGCGPWRVDFAEVDRMVQRRLAASTCRLAPHTCGLFLLRLVIDRRFGFQAEIFDVVAESLHPADEAGRIETLQRRIETEGWGAAQRAMADPGVPSRVAVVSSPSALGLQDFVSAVSSVCRVRLVEAAMAGDAAVRQVPDALSAAEFNSDLVVVARGGGSASEMSWADDERVVRAVAASPVPVWVAIGHADDRHLIDLVAHRSFGTPSHAAAEVLRRVARAASLERERILELERAAAEERAAESEARAETRVRRTATVAVAVVLVLVVLLVRMMVVGG